MQYNSYIAMFYSNSLDIHFEEVDNEGDKSKFYLKPSADSSVRLFIGWKDGFKCALPIFLARYGVDRAVELLVKFNELYKRFNMGQGEMLFRTEGTQVVPYFVVDNKSMVDDATVKEFDIHYV